MSREIQNISARLSLRPPQRESLEILAKVADLIPLKKERDLAKDLAAIKGNYPTVEDFERDFPSLCFALATGVGKTRLMGAFISYLHLAKGVRNFFVLAPNLTIYNKLIADFTPNTPKYVFQGIAEFAVNPPEIVTGDNYETGRGVRKRDLLGESGVHVNIFNISKINSEVRGGAAPRIKRLAEYIGQSYFDYLAGLPDLVLLMDESHRYRASAGVRAINELKPVLGLELTATPQVEAAGRAVAFKNVIYSYPLSQALVDGFVKEPAVATRENFDAKQYSKEQLERVKLEDGVRVHEAVKVELEVFARQNSKPVVKPFMLVVAEDTTHAEKLMGTIKQGDFFEGRYKDRVITVHSNQRGEESEETVARLLAVEDPNEPTEIVVHVNMLKEGWDVTNLYTIVPLRAANSKTLVEQSIGRGLRLPYGQKTGVKTVDRLTIVAHDRFQDIIDEANKPDSIIKTGVIIGRDIPLERKEAVVVKPLVETMVAEPVPGTAAATPAAQKALPFQTPEEREVAQVAMEVIHRRFERLPRSYDLKKKENLEKLAAEAAAEYAVRKVQGTLPGVVEQPDIPKIVEKTVTHFIERTIDIPRIVLVPKGDVKSGFKDFNLDVSNVRLQPVSMEILLQELRTNQQERLAANGAPIHEERPENYLVGGLVDHDDICYDEHSELLYKLAGQVVRHLKSYLPDAEAVENVLQYHRRSLVELVHTQMQPHYWESPVEYEADVRKGFTQLRSNNYTADAGQQPRNFRQPVEERQLIRGMLFGGFQKCLYAVQKFQSDSERRLAVIFENDKAVLKWLKPEKGQFQIFYGRDQSEYIPDFAVEAEAACYLCEPKRADEMTDPVVVEKSRAAAQWCVHATEHGKKYGGKPWSYLFIPHDKTIENMTLDGLAETFVVK